MAGAALTTPYQLEKPDLFFKGRYLIKSGEIINSGDLVGVDNSGYMVNASKTAGAIVKPRGVAVFTEDNSTATYLTGDGATIYANIARWAVLRGSTAYPLNTTLIPGLGPGKPVYLGALGTSTVSNYTCTLTSTNGDAIVAVGYVNAAGTTVEVFVDPNAALQYQTAGNSTLTLA